MKAEQPRTRFSPLRTLRSGPEGRVWLAEDRLRGGAAVIKAARSGTARAEERLREGALVSSLSHPRLVRFLDFVQEAEDPEGVPTTGFATAWVDGEHLGAGLVDLPREVRLTAFARAAELVAWLHRRGWLHLDLKPANLLAIGREVTVVDLGSAVPRDQGPGHTGGTPGYAAPEVVLGEAPTEAADVYGLGAVLYELLSGRVAVHLAEGEALRERVAQPPLPVRALAPGVPREHAVLAEAMLAAAPADRPELAEVRACLGVEVEPAGEPPLVGQEGVLAAIDGLLQARDVDHLALVGPGASRVLRAAQARCALRGEPTLELGERPPPRLPRSTVVLLRDPAPGVVAALLEAGHTVLQAAAAPVAATVQLRTARLDAEAVEILGRFHGVSDGSRLATVLRRSGGRFDRADALLSRQERVEEAPGPTEARALLEAAGPDTPVEDLLPLAAALDGDEERLWRGRLRVRAGRMQEALEDLRSLELGPEDRLLAARAARRCGELELAGGWLAGFERPTPEHVRLALAEGAVERATAIGDALLAAEPGEAALLVRVLVALHRLDIGLDDRVTQLLERVDERAGSALLSAAGRLSARTGDERRAHVLLAAAAAAADREGDSTRSAAVRLNLGNLLHAHGHGEGARRAFTRAWLIAEAAGAPDLALRICFSLAELELRTGRLPAAEQRLADFDALGGGEEARARGRVLRARLQLARGRAGDCLAVLDAGEARPADMATLLRVQALLELGRADDATAVLDGSPEPEEPWLRLQRDAARGRALVLEGREILREVRERLGEGPPSAARRLETGALLLATAGEELDPEGFAARRGDLQSAATLLRGRPAARAAALRDQLVERPGASLDEVARVLEALEDPERFPRALARLVRTSLGVNRVLIMMRIPGLGNQIGYQELSGEEAAGIAGEVLEHIRGPEDIWKADDAFADAHLRRVSATVRTFELKSLLAVAIPCRGRRVGALYVDDLHRAGRFGEEDVQLLKRVARAAGRLLPLAGPGADPLDEPAEVCGVVLPAEEVAPLRRAVDTLAGRRESNVLVTGPTGVGKTWFVRRLATDVFGLRGVEELVLRQGDLKMLVGQLAGVRRGDYTGAVERQGAIARALRQRKLLFLDEIQALDPEAQQVLLPLLDLPERRLGGLSGSLSPLTGPLHVVLGTNAPVERGAWKESFREDFWYRISSAHLHLLPLADRGPEVVYWYLRCFLGEAGAGAPEEVLEPGALRWATTAAWPGNLRELRAWAQEVAAAGATLGRRLRREEVVERGSSQPEPRRWDSDAKVQRVMGALRRADWIQARAARELGMNKSNLHRFLKHHGLLDEVRRHRR